MKVFAYQLVVQGPTGQGWAYTKKFFETEQLAEEAGKAEADMIGQIWQQGKIVMPTEQGPRVLMDIKSFLAMLGIANIGGAGISGEMQGAVLVAAPRVLGSNGRPLS